MSVPGATDGGLLLPLARSLQVEILVHWLEMTDIGRLDSAVCSKTHRESFLEILREDYCVFQHSFPVRSLFTFAWVLKRAVKMAHACIDSDGTLEQQQQFFTLCGKHTTSLTNEYITESICEEHVQSESLRMLIDNVASSCPKIKELQLEDSNFYGNTIDAILMNCPELSRVELNSNRNVQFRLLASIWNTPNSVTYLDICNCIYLEDSPTCALNDNHTLSVLFAPDQNEGRFILPFILKCRSLRVLVVDGLDFDQMVTVLTECKTLAAISVGLELEADEYLSDQDINRLLPLIQNLTALHLCDVQYDLEMDEMHVLTIVQHCPNLRTLSTEHYLDSETAQKYALMDRDSRSSGRGKGVHVLETLEVNTISADTLRSVLALCPHLTTLCVKDWCSDGEESTADAFFAVIGQSKIRSIELGDCSILSSRHLLHCRELTSAKFTNAKTLKNSDVIGIVDRNPMLTGLHLFDCPLLTKVSLLYILKHCVHLTELTFTARDPRDWQKMPSKPTDLDFMYQLARLYRPTLGAHSVRIEL